MSSRLAWASTRHQLSRQLNAGTAGPKGPSTSDIYCLKSALIRPSILFSTSYSAARPRTFTSTTMAQTDDGKTAASTVAPPLRESAVGGALLFKFPNGDTGARPQVALFRRSDKVSTYRHHLAPISGGVEKTDANPLATAWRELNEETTLTPADIELWRAGKPFTFGDSGVGRLWTINPFGFRLKTLEEGGRGEAGITIDWEHEGWGWYDPRDVNEGEDFGGVPRLTDSLRRVWYEYDLGDSAGAVLSEGLNRLRTDQQSGARELAGVALGILRDVIAALDYDAPTAKWWAQARFAAWHIWKNGRESMGAAIMSVLLSALQGMEETVTRYREEPNSNHAMRWKDSILENLQRRIDMRVESGEVLARAFAAYLEATFASRLTSDAASPISILTLSESSTISSSLQNVISHTKFGLDLRVLESRPLNEGVSTAATIAGFAASASAKPGVKVTIFTDASAALASQGVDLVLLGADRIAGSGAVSNKTGSFPAVLAARHVSPGVKIVVLSDTEKVARPGDPSTHIVENNEPGQVTRVWSSGVSSHRVREAAASISKLSDAGGGAGRNVEGTPSGARVAVQNVFFEWVPPGLVDVYVTECGTWSPDDIRSHSEKLGAEEDRIFRDL